MSLAGLRFLPEAQGESDRVRHAAGHLPKRLSGANITERQG